MVFRDVAAPPDGSDGEIEGADYDQKGPAGWMYKCKAFKMRNYWPSKFNEHGVGYNPWNEEESMYTFTIKGASAKTRLIIFAGGYGDEILGRLKTTVELTVNGETKTYTMNPAINRIGLKGCWVNSYRLIG